LLESLKSKASPLEGFILIGHLGKTFQLQGGLRFYALGEAEAEAVSALSEISLNGALRQVERVRPVGKHLILYLAGITDVEAASRLVGLEVYARRAELPENAGQVYAEVLVGLPVCVDGRPFGEVAEVQRGAQDLLVIHRQGERHLLPLGADYVSLTEDAVQVKGAPEGLFDLSL
jgi:16S rRNA processing protein RimM